MDERQKQVRGEIFTQGCIGLVLIMLVIAFVNDFDIFKIDAYFTLPEILINLVNLLVAYVLSALILRDAYFGVVSGNQMKTCLWVFTLLSLALDIPMVIFKGAGISPVSISSVIMSNSIMLSLWYKRKSW